MDFSKIFTPKAIAANFTEVYSNEIPFLGTAYFPARKQAGLDLKWIKGHNDLPVSLAPSTFDAKARFRDRISIQAIQTEMPFFREGMLIKEKDRQEMLRAQNTDDPYAQAVIETVFDDTRNLVMGANVVPERMIWQLLAPTNGKPGISIVANGVDYTYDYDPDDSFKTNNFMEVSTNKWNVPASADPLSDLQTAKQKAQERTGVVLTTAVMSRKTFNYLLKADSVKSAVLAQNATANVLMTDAVVKALVMEQLGLNIIIYSKMFKDETKTSKAFYPDDMVTLLPDGTIGSTWYGTTPEEADLMGDSGAQVAIVNTGVAITSIVTKHPVNTEIYASEIVLPSFERMDDVFVMKVV